MTQRVDKISLSSKDKLLLFENLGTMLTAGIPLPEALAAFEQETQGNLRAVLETLKNDVNEGKSIGESLSRMTGAFDPVVTSLIKAAEEDGTLDKTLKKELTASTKRDIAFADSIKAAVLYPITVMIVFVMVLILFLTIVIPRIAQVFESLNVTLPLPTQMIIIISRVYLANLILINATILALFLLLWYLYKQKKQVFLRFVFALPVISTLGTTIDLARFTHTLSVLLSSGIPITEALTLTRHVVARRQMSVAIEKLFETVTAGKNLSDGLKLTPGLFPSVAILVIEAGERSGTLEKSMEELSEYFETQVSNRLKQISTLIEPILLVFVGVLVGALMLAIITPLYNLIGNITPK